MKELFISLFLVCFSICGFAQEHLSFKGIQIEGSMTAFCQKLKAKGFSQLGRDNNFTLFTGDFTGRQANVGVASTDDGKNVHSVVVLFDKSEDWNTLVNTYDYYKALYIRKYGEPNACLEYNPSKSDSNISLMYQLGQGTVTYASEWNVIGGTIELLIEKVDYSKGMVVIKYRDSQNVEAKIQKDLEDI